MDYIRTSLAAQIVSNVGNCSGWPVWWSDAGRLVPVFIKVFPLVHTVQFIWSGEFH